jgi:hypothetical protein
MSYSILFEAEAVNQTPVNFQFLLIKIGKMSAKNRTLPAAALKNQNAGLIIKKQEKRSIL